MIALMNEVLFHAEMRELAQWENADEEDYRTLEKKYDLMIAFIEDIERQMERNKKDVTLCQ
jgi:Mg2+ and Co2+ transporter CorA